MAKQVSPPVNDLILALFSLALGFIVWVIVRQNEIQTQTKLVPVRFENLPPYIQLSEESPYEPDRIAISFSYPKGEETLANTADVRITIDLSQLDERVSSTESFTPCSMRVTRQMVEFPPQLTLIEFVSAPEVVFNARMMVARARVIPNVEGDPPAEGYQIRTGDIIVEPAEIAIAVDRVRYELSLVQPLTVTTERIDVAGKKETLRKRVGIVFEKEPGILPLPGQSAPIVEVFVPITELSMTATISDVPIRYEPLKRGVIAELAPKTGNVTITGPTSLVSEVSAEMIQLSPRPSEFLDDEIIGESFETIIDASINSPNPRFEREVRLQVEPARVNVSFYSSEPPAEPITAPRVQPPSTPIPRVLPPENEPAVTTGTLMLPLWQLNNILLSAR